MTCHFYYKCNKCGHEEPDKGGEDMKSYVCPKCGSNVVCDNKNQIIGCDFEDNGERKKSIRSFIP